MPARYTSARGCTPTSFEVGCDRMAGVICVPRVPVGKVYLQNRQGEIDGGGVPLNLPSFDDAVPTQPSTARPSPDNSPQE